MEEVTAHAQSDSLEDAREICADGNSRPHKFTPSFDGKEIGKWAPSKNQNSANISLYFEEKWK
jgi:hypothetical protein